MTGSSVSVVNKILMRVSSADNFFHTGRNHNARYNDSGFEAATGCNNNGHHKVGDEDGATSEIGSLWMALLSSKWDKARHRLKKHSKDACVNHPHLSKDLPLHFAIKQGAPLYLIYALIKAYPECTIMKDTTSMRTPLCLAALQMQMEDQDSCEIYLFLLNLDPKASNIPDIHGRIPLHYLVYNNKLNDIEHTLRYNSKLSVIEDNQGFTPKQIVTKNKSIADNGESMVKLFERYCPTDHHCLPRTVNEERTMEHKRTQSANALAEVLRGRGSSSFCAPEDYNSLLPMIHEQRTKKEQMMKRSQSASSVLTEVFRERDSLCNDVAHIMGSPLIKHQTTAGSTWDESDDDDCDEGHIANGPIYYEDDNYNDDEFSLNDKGTGLIHYTY